jgi:uncharacterized repeat protein (TIGR03803 family)
MTGRFHVVGVMALIAAVLVGCGGSHLPIGAPGVIPQSTMTSAQTVPQRLEQLSIHQERVGSKYKILTSFATSYDGQFPYGSLLNVNGKLYGTTAMGGSLGLGNLFSITTTGKEKVLYSFHADPDSNGPEGGLIEMNGTLYGMAGGGEYHEGTVFSVTTTGTERALYSFGSHPNDAAYPDMPALVYIKGKLYGMTVEGGEYGRGAVFSVTTRGAEKVVYSFGGYYDDGESPYGGLAYVKGLFYGTTRAGGSTDYRYDGAGTVFSLTASGTQKVLHSFGVPLDGHFPEAGLINVSDTLYGTTYNGGGTYDAGTVFSITTTGTEKVLHRFGYGSDGSFPCAALLNVSGTLYGTTSGGGADGWGTVFSMSPTGTEKVLHSFGFGSDGATPLAGLIDVKGTLYGTTSAGGAYGNGTVFALTP